MKPDISEFSYGYAVTEQLVAALGPAAAAPRFPSLIQEGKLGYDLELNLPLRASLFLQFKLSDRMVRASAIEIRDNDPPGLTLPFFRAHLRPRPTSAQHDLLCDLADEGEEVYYVAPEFDTIGELDAAYRARMVVRQSAFFAVADIGRFTDDDPHHLVFVAGDAVGWCCSKPKEVRRHDGAELGRVERPWARGERPRTLRDELERLIALMLEILEAAKINVPRRTKQGWPFGDDRPDLLAPYLARTFFSSELLLVASEPRKSKYR